MCDDMHHLFAVGQCLLAVRDITKDGKYLKRLFFALLKLRNSVYQ